MGNWFTRLFQKKVRKPISEMTPKERLERKLELLEMIQRALRFNRRQKILLCARELVELFPQYAYGWELVVNSLDELGRHAEADEAAAQAVRALGKPVTRMPRLR